MSFESDVELSITIPERELRSARSEIEDGLSDVPVGMSSSGSAARAMSDGGMNAGASARQSRRLFRWARSRTEDIEDILSVVEDIEEQMGEGGDGGGGGGFGRILRRGGRLGGGLLLGGGLAVTAAMVIGEKATIVASDVIADPLAADDILVDAFPLGASALLAGSLPIGVGALLSDAFPIDPSDVIDGGGSGDGGSKTGDDLLDYVPDNVDLTDFGYPDPTPPMGNRRRTPSPTGPIYDPMPWFPFDPSKMNGKSGTGSTGFFDIRGYTNDQGNLEPGAAASAFVEGLLATDTEAKKNTAAVAGVGASAGLLALLVGSGTIGAATLGSAALMGSAAAEDGSGSETTVEVDNSSQTTVEADVDFDSLVDDVLDEVRRERESDLDDLRRELESAVGGGAGGARIR